MLLAFCDISIWLFFTFVVDTDMKNVDLNPGGFIGALICGGIVAAIVFPNIDVNTAGRGVYRMPILGLVAGAFVGNFLWATIFKKNS